jgi:hypothetical protein
VFVQTLKGIDRGLRLMRAPRGVAVTNDDAIAIAAGPWGKTPDAQELFMR